MCNFIYNKTLFRTTVLDKKNYVLMNLILYVIDLMLYNRTNMAVEHVRDLANMYI